MKKQIITLPFLHKNGWKTRDKSITETVLEKGHSTLWWDNAHHKPLQQTIQKNGKKTVLKNYEI